MKNITRHFGMLTIVERLKSSANGNPRFRCIVDDVCFITKADCSYCYKIKNLEGKYVEVTVGTHYGKCTLNSIHYVDEIDS